MNMRRVLSLVALTLVVWLVSACGTAPTPTPKPTLPLPTASPTPLPPTPTPVPPTPTPLPPTPTTVPPQATAKQQTNARQGPGTQFAIAGKMPANTSVAILGKSEDAKWFQVAFPDAAHPAWVPSEFVTVTGTIEQVQVIAVAPPPTPTRGAVVAAATKTPAATPTQAFPPPRGSMMFVSAFDTSQNSYVLYNLGIEPRSYGASRLLGPQSFDLDQNTKAAPFSMSPTSARFAYVFSTGNKRDKLRVTNPSNLDLSQDRDLDSHQGISSPTFSPDGSRIAYIGLDNDFGTQFIYMINVDDQQRPFSPFGARYDDQRKVGEVFRGLAWGKTYLLFVSNFSGAFEIWRLNGDLTGPQQITTDKRENISPAWSPDGKYFAYSSKQVDGSYQIMIANADGSNPRKLTNAGHNFTPTFSPDGNWIAFMSNRGGKMDIWVMNKNGGNVQLLTDKFNGQGQLPGGWR